MQTLGKKLGEGATAEVYEFGEGHVIKVVKPTIPASIIDYEAWVTRTVSEAGAVTPTVGELVEVDGRRGFVMERVEGRPLLEVFLTGEMTPAAWMHLGGANLCPARRLGRCHEPAIVPRLCQLYAQSARGTWFP